MKGKSMRNLNRSKKPSIKGRVWSTALGVIEPERLAYGWDRATKLPLATLPYAEVAVRLAGRRLGPTNQRATQINAGSRHYNFAHVA